MAFARTRLMQLSPIKAVELAAARRAGVVSLAQGIPSFDTPQFIKDAVAEKMAQGLVAKYSLAPGLRSLRDRVAESLLQEGMRYDPDGEILITAGSIEGIAATLLTLTEPGDEVIIPSPTYTSYQQVIRLAGCQPVFAPLDEEHNFDLHVEAIARRITPRTRAIFYCNPNNPTGTLYSKAQSLRMMELAEQNDLTIITDEVYKDFVYTQEPYFSPAQVEAFRHRVVRIFSFSKAYAMTGWRVGYLHTHRALATEILKVHDALVTCAPVISQYAAQAALEAGEPAIAAFRQAYRQRRDLMLRHLDSLSHIFDYQKPNGAYFVFPRLKDTVPLSADSQRLAFDMLERVGVALVPGVAFGPTGEGHLRMSFGREEADINEAFSRMKAYFANPQTPAFHALPGLGQAAAAETSTQSVSVTGRGGRLHRWLRPLGVGYLSALARLFLWRQRPIIIAIAGNHGKTVAKRILSGLLAQHFALRANPRSYNTQIGLPLGVLGLEIDPRTLWAVVVTLLRATWRAFFGREPLQVLVVELGTRHRGDMAALLQTVRPHWAVATHFTPAGTEDLVDADVLLGEFVALAQVVPTQRLLVSEDDALLTAHRQTSGLAPLLVGKQHLVPQGRGYRFVAQGQSFAIGPELVGDSALYAMQAAVVLACQLGVPLPTIHQYLLAETGSP